MVKEIIEMIDEEIKKCDSSMDADADAKELCLRRLKDKILTKFQWEFRQNKETT